MNMIRSEAHKDHTDEEFKAFQENVNNMSEDELEEFLSNIDPDSMGFDGKEGM